jgi:hypothetical protein
MADRNEKRIARGGHYRPPPKKHILGLRIESEAASCDSVFDLDQTALLTHFSCQPAGGQSLCKMTFFTIG